MIGRYPDFTPLELTDRDELDPLFRALPEGLSELTFAGIFCFAGPHTYLATRLEAGEEQTEVIRDMLKLTILPALGRDPSLLIDFAKEHHVKRLYSIDLENFSQRVSC